MGRASAWRWLLPALCALLFALVCANAWEWVGVNGRPWFGYWDSVTVPTEEPFIAQIVQAIPGGAAARAGIRNGDRVDLRRLGVYDRLALLFQPITTKPTHLVVERAGRTVDVQFIASTRYEADAGWKLATTALYYLASVAMLGCALLLALRRWTSRDGRYLCLTLLAFVAAVNVTPSNLILPNGVAGAFLFLIGGCCACAAALLPVLMGVTFGVRSAWRSAVQAAAIAVVLLALSGYVAGTIGLIGASIDPLPFIFGGWRIAYVAMYAAATVAVSLAAASTPLADRPRSAWLLLPLPISMFLYAILVQLTTSAPSWAGYMTLYLIAYFMMLAGAAAVTYALLKRRVLDVAFVIGRTLVVGCVSAIIVVAFVLLEWLLGTVATNASHATGLAANAALALVLGLSMSFIHKRVDAFVDFAFFHKRHEDERALRDFAKEAAFVTRHDDLLDRTIEMVHLHTDATAAAVILEDGGAYRAVRSFGDLPAEVDENDALILALKAKHTALDPNRYPTNLLGDVVLPMSARGRLLGVLVCGRRAGGEAYAPDEVEALRELASGIGSALDSIDRADGVRAHQDAIVGALQAIQEVAERGAENSAKLLSLLSQTTFDPRR